MSNKKYPFTQITISNKIGRPINSIVRMSNWKDFYIQSDLGLKTFAAFFNDLPSNKKASIQFEVTLKGVRLLMKRKDETDFPIDYFLKEEAKTKAITHLFGTVFSQYYKFIKNELESDFAKIEIQFLRKKISTGIEKIIINEKTDGEGSLIILNRKNIVGGESQILERQEDNSEEVIFQQNLEVGDFVFLKNRNREKQNIFHQLTPISLDDKNQKGWIDLIDLMRFEIVE